MRGLRASGDRRADAGGFRGLLRLVASPLAEAHGLALGERAARDALAVVVTSYEFHGGFRVRTLSA